MLLGVSLVSLLAVGCLMTAATADMTPVVKIKTGDIQGLMLKSDSGRAFNGFVGIPYGKSPSGPLRFKPPQPAEPWEGTFSATNPTAFCPQLNLATKQMFGQEDCLHLNVYTPKLPTDSTTSGLPVLVFIHGGAFFFGTGSFLIYRPHRYMDKDVVVVTLNYRLGLLGFLDTEDDLSPGNYGLLDQALSLRWIQQNIRQFGGDPAKVTIFGESAGGASVLFHLLSPQSKGLFSSVISQSGSPLNHFAIQPKPLDVARRASIAINCSSSITTQELFDCFKETSALDLALATASLQTGLLPLPGFSPSYNVHNEFLPAPPLKLFKEGRLNKVPVIAGVMESEGYLLLLDIRALIKTKGKQYVSEQFCTHVSYAFDIKGNMTDVCDRIVKEYFEGSDVEDNEVLEQGLVKALGDSAISSIVSKTLDYLSEAGVPVQAYKFTHKTEHVSIPELGGVPACIQDVTSQTHACHEAIPGKYASHADELTLQLDFRPFTIPKDPNEVRPLNAKDREVNEILSSVWTQFAENQKNQLEYSAAGEKFSWPIYTVANRQYVELKAKPEVKSGRLNDKTVFWDEEIPKLAKEYRARNKEEL